VIVLPNGFVLKVALRYTIARKRKLFSYASLYGQALTISRMADFWQHYHRSTADEDLLQAFFEALNHGDEKLGWDGVGTTTAVQYLRYLNAFFDWWALEMRRPNPNPLQEEHTGWVTVLAEQRRQNGNKLLAHLYPATPEGQGWRKTRSNEPDREAKRDARPKDRPKAMDLEDYVKLITHEEDPGHRALWLVLGAGGRRISEALHILIPHDIGLNPITGEARVRVADPRYGKISVKQNGKNFKMTRQAYLQKNHQMLPRVLEKPGGGRQAGWKGIRDEDSAAKSKELVWMAPQFGRLMWETHKEYMQLRDGTGAEHPFYFVNTRRNLGAPLTASNARQLLRTACKHLGIKSRTNLHSLRHVFGNFLACELKLKDHLITLAFGHRSLASAAAYTRPTHGQLRTAIVTAEKTRQAMRSA
jgi:integrase